MLIYQYMNIHGEAKRGLRMKEYLAWKEMRQRCNNPRHKQFNDYGGRGISVCERWMLGYGNFITDVGRAPSEKHSLDRIDNSGNYEPGNVRWADRFTQNRNTRRNIMVTHNGETKCLSQWAEDSGIYIKTLRARMEQYGWSFEKAISTPLRPNWSRGRGYLT